MNFAEMKPTVAQVNTLLDAARSALRLRSDAALSRELGVAPPVISKLRHGVIALGETLVVRLIEKGIDLDWIKMELSAS